MTDLTFSPVSLFFVILNIVTAAVVVFAILIFVRSLKKHSTKK